MPVNKLAVLSCALVLCGCATTPSSDNYAGEALADGSEAAEQEVVGQDKSKWVCKTERLTGSNRIERVCYTREVAESLRERTQDGMFRRVRNTACTDCTNDG